MAGYHQAHDSEELKAARKDAGAWLKKLRKDAGVTQLDVARACGYEYVTFISQIESGKGRIPPDKYETFAKVYNADPKWFAENYLRFTDPYMFKLLFGSNKQGWGEEAVFLSS
jgi:transcriptional regulator with XRE-family HTH domain